jgi:hypothetical protein
MAQTFFPAICLQFPRNCSSWDVELIMAKTGESGDKEWDVDLQRKYERWSIYI